MIGYDDGKALMAQGPSALHEHVASRLETSLGKALPQMEVRFKDVSISADIVVKDASDLEVQLPTLPNEMMKTIHGLVAKRHTVTKRVLKGVSGVLKPGTITLVLGQPGSGKSSLMKLLSGRFPKDKNVSIEGEVTYNGTSVEKLHKRLPQLVSYVPQRDKHYPELTVKETLEFAHAACGGEFPERDAKYLVNGTPEENAEALTAAKALVKHYPDVVIQQLGLENCQNTIVGDAMHRGVSGGERKRVTTGEMAFGNKYVMMMDEISTGLDSAATFDIITTQRSIAKKFRKTVNGTPEENAEALTAAKALVKHYPDVVIQQLGLESCQNTIVGDAMHRGVSGGERKRVTTGEMAFGNKYVMMMDEISTGLDSAATFDIITTQRSIAKKFRKTVVISLLQPSPEVFALFNDVMILNAGHLMYHGPCEEALGYFEGLGLQCPPSRDVADFLLDLGTNKQYQYEVKLERGGVVPRSPSDFAEAFQRSSIYNHMLKELGDPVEPSLVEDMKTHMLAQPEFSRGFWRSTSLLMKRQLTITKRETTALIGRLIMNTTIALLCSTVYYQFDLTDAQVAMGIMFESILNLSIGQAAQVPTVMAALLYVCVFAGYTITKDQIPDYLIWLYWGNPIAWGIRALAYGMKMGEYSLSTYEVPSEKYWLWFGMIFMIATYVFFLFLSCIALEYHRFESPENVVLDAETTAKSTDNYVAAQTPRSSPSGGEVEVPKYVEPGSKRHQRT
ncbi:ABC Superfamily, partial [Phytophthora palmivora]